MLPIAINGRFLSQPVTGVQRHARELISTIDAMLASGELNPPDDPVELLTPPGPLDPPRLQCIKLKVVGRSRGQFWEQIFLPSYCRGKLLFTPCGGAPLLHRRHVFTIPDAGVFSTPSSYTRAYGAWYRWHHRRAAKIPGLRLLTVSEFSRRELQKWLSIAASRIDVIPLGHEHMLAHAADGAVLAKLGLTPRQFILTVGSANPNKNFRGLVEAFGLLQNHPTLSLPQNFRLVIAGNANSRIFQQHKLSAENVVCTGPVNDGELRALYENATCFVLPSFYEGFGLPLLEAMALGCPTLSSNRASLPEVGSNAAIYFNPDSPQEMANAIASVLSDRTLQEDLIERGNKQSRLFRWRETARRTWAILVETAGCGNQG